MIQEFQNMKIMRPLLRKIKALIRAICFRMFNFIYKLIVPLKEDNVCFLAETHKELNGNLKAVYDYIISQPEYAKLKTLVYTREDRRERHSILTTLAIWRALSSSKYILLDDLYKATAHMKCRKEQEMIQLWHGPGAYKKFGYSRKDLPKKVGGKLRVHKGYKNYTKVIVSGSKIAWCYAEGFGIDESKVYACGTPRIDKLFDENYIKQTKNSFLENNSEFVNKKIVLFAPTYRGTLVENANYDFDKANLNKLSKMLGEEYVIFTRWHPALKNNIARGIAHITKCDFGKRIIDFTNYENVNDLLIACDVLVTDYSSIIFDYFPLKKPVVYFAYDRKEYDGDRGFYYNFDKYIYGSVVEDTEKLVEAIKAEKTDGEQRRNFYDLFMDGCDEHSTERVCNLIWN